MANTVNKNNTSKIKSTNQNVKGQEESKNSLIMNVLVVLGVVILGFIIVYLMNYFFVEKSYIKINMSTDKKLEYIKIDDKKELVTSQKYVSDLNYSMRYDIDNFTVFKYKEQDFFKLKDDEKVLIIIEKSGLPNSCKAGSLEMTYNNCYVKVDNYTEEHYISTNGKTYKITVKSSNNENYTQNLKTRIDYMLNSFEMNFK